MKCVVCRPETQCANAVLIGAVRLGIWHGAGLASLYLTVARWGGPDGNCRSDVSYGNFIAFEATWTD